MSGHAVGQDRQAVVRETRRIAVGIERKGKALRREAGNHPVEQRQARDTLSWARTRRPEEEVRDTHSLAAADYVYAETLRMRSEEIVLPQGGVAEQRPVLEQRAQLLLDAQRAYFDSIRRQHPDWAAAAGYQIGAMYDTFWTTIMEAPTPPPASPLEGELLQVYEEEYRTSLARLVKRQALSPSAKR